jgi:hypothetical protein
LVTIGEPTFIGGFGVGISQHLLDRHAERLSELGPLVLDPRGERPEPASSWSPEPVVA